VIKAAESTPGPARVRGESEAGARRLTRRAGVDAVVIKSLTGHVTEKMREHYSTVALDEKLVAVSSVHRPRPSRSWGCRW
jgi:hypothetical protein